MGSTGLEWTGLDWAGLGWAACDQAGGAGLLVTED